MVGDFSLFMATWKPLVLMSGWCVRISPHKQGSIHSSPPVHVWINTFISSLSIGAELLDTIPESC